MRKLTQTILSISLFCGASFMGMASAENYPEKPVKIIVAYQAGQGTDIATRYFADYLSKELGETFFVENHGGAGGNIGTRLAANAKPDGYTLTMGTNATHALNAFLYSDPGFEPVNDFDPVILTGTFPMVLLTTPDSPLTSIDKILETVTDSSKKADIAMPSTTARLVYEFLKERTGVDLYGIPYKDSGTALSNLIGGDVEVSIDTIMAARSNLSAGRLVPIAVTSLKETGLLPDVSTVASQGIDDFEVIAWNGLFAPKGTPQEIIEKLNETLDQFLKQDATQQKLLELGYDAGGGSPDRLRDLVKNESEKWGPIIDHAGLKFD